MVGRGWDMYFKDDEEIVSVYRDTIKGTKLKCKNNISEKEYMKYENIIDKINKKSNSNNKAYMLSKFMPNSNINNLEDIFKKVEEIINSKEENSGKKLKRKFIYSYYEYPDKLIHQFGTNSKEVKKEINMIEENIENLYSKIDGNTIVIITADHGLVDTTDIILKDYPEIFNMLEHSTLLEERALSMKLKKGVNQKQFAKRFNEYFSEYFKLYSKDEIIELKLLGKEITKEIVIDNLGEYIGIGISNKCMKYEKDEKSFKANHGGITKEEMEVPLIILRK